VPELPEVEYAARVAREVAVGRVITRLALLHPSHRRALSPRRARGITGDRVVRIDRAGKLQRLLLASGRALEVHFRMTGDWATGKVGDPLPRFARALIEFDDGGRLVLDDPRALSRVTLADHATRGESAVGPDPTQPGFLPARLAAALAGKRVSIKVALLDQRIVAGLGNIYAAEALWYARVDPRAPAGRLTARRISRLTTAIRRVLARATRNVERYYGAASTAAGTRFAVYDREGEPCRRCGSTIARIVQGGRSTYFCPRCQR
jgi:formamidopyrimidine-DNA glycosylase